MTAVTDAEYTAKEVAAHAVSEDCYMVIQGKGESARLACSIAYADQDIAKSTMLQSTSTITLEEVTFW